MEAALVMMSGEAVVVEAPSVAAGFEALYEAEYAAMVRLARGLVDTTEQAEEIVQDAYTKVFDRWNSLKEPGGYLRTAVVNGSRSELRKREVRRRIGLDRPLDSGPDERDHMVDALAKLSPNRKTALVLRFYADLPEKEIAELMGVRPGTVKSTISRALAELRKEIDR